MKYSKSVYLLIMTLLSSASYQVFSQERDKDKDKQRTQQVERLHKTDRGMDRNWDRDRLHDGFGGSIYATELMTDKERLRYREKLQMASSEQERNNIRQQHQKEMELREQYREQYEDGMEGIIYGASQMTEQQRNQYREQLKNAKSEQERKKIREQHKKAIDDLDPDTDS
jgi:hypothetical protein